MLKTFLWVTLLILGLGVGGSSILGQGLDFGDVSTTTSIQTESSRYPLRVLANSIILPLSGIVIVFCIWLIISAKDDAKSLHHQFCLYELPKSAKGVATLVWISYAMVHIFAVVTVYLKTTVAYESSQAYFFYTPIHKLTALSHAHYFGHATMYIITASLFLFTAIPERLKRAIIVLAPLGAILDNASWWGMKLASHHYEYISYGSGAMISIGFGAMVLTTCLQMWSATYSRKDVNS